MKASRPGIILLATALLSPAPAKPLQSPPVGGTTSPEEPCGNPLPSKTPICPTCVDKDDNIYSLPVGSTCKTNSILAYNGNAHRKITDLEIAGSVGGMPLKFIRYSNTRLSS
nr:hypothetical protein [Akkermansiaceae bacterium]